MFFFFLFKVATEKEIEIQETEKLIQENNEKEKELLQQELEKLKKQGFFQK